MIGAPRSFDIEAVACICVLRSVNVDAMLMFSNYGAWQQWNSQIFNEWIELRMMEQEQKESERIIQFHTLD